MVLSLGSPGSWAGQRDDAAFLPELRAFLAELMCTPHNSRYVEAEHSKIQVGLRKASQGEGVHDMQEPVLMLYIRSYASALQLHP